MAPFRRNRYLTCFYCNRRTSTRYDGDVRRFDCPNCDATNYLDENGEITDPPVATTSSSGAATPIRYATAPLHLSPPPPPPPPQPQPPQSSSSCTSSAAAAVFCATCLKNQHLFTASLAQYLPDDPDKPDYAEAEREYYRFRRRLERRYPQICADCEPRVRRRMEQAVYTAKADLLRRMIDRTAATRKVKRRGLLDFTDVAGKWLWVSGLLLQVVWHVSVLGALASVAVGFLDGDGGIWVRRLLQTWDEWSLSPSATDALIRWSVLVGASGAWWNPRLVQTIRGFTRHINGLPQWYTYQVLTVAVRALLSRMVSSLPSSEPSMLTLQVACHLCGLGFASFIYSAAPRSIKTDTAPLFGISPKQASPEPEVTEEYNDSSIHQSMGQLLDEIANTPSAAARPAAPEFNEFPALQQTPRRPGSALQTQAAIGQAPSDLDMATLDLSRPPAVQYEQEMDWTPTQSKHRAFSTYGQQRKPRFGETPTEPRKGPFWYRVPPAPTTPAQRLFNPPNQPRLRQSPVGAKEQQDVFAFRSGSTGGGAAQSLLPAAPAPAAADPGPDKENQVPFAEPSFFPPAAQNDPRNSLSDMFGQSLALSREERERRSSGWLGGSFLGLIASKRGGR